MLYLSKPEFLYPRARDYAFDEVAEQLVREFELRHFDVPGLSVEFRVYGSGRQRMRYVSRISGEDFSLKFGRSQGVLPGGTWSNTAAVDSVVIPREKISVYGDKSGPSYWLYMGDDDAWNRDRANFLSCFHSPSVHLGVDGEPRPYLEYTGSAESDRQVRYSSRYSTSVAPYLVHNNDLGRGYDPEGDEPRYLTTEAVIGRMAAYLKGVLLRVKREPVPSEPFEFVEETSVAVQGCPEFWAVVGNRALQRIREGSDTSPAKQYALFSGWRLCSLDINAGEGVDPLVYEGFLWAGLDPAKLHRNAIARDFGDKGSLVRLAPKYANDIYVVDEAAYDRSRAELSKVAERKRRDQFTREEIDANFRARALTFVPWADYDGSYEKPVILIRRELDFDEVEIVGSSSD